MNSRSINPFAWIVLLYLRGLLLWVLVPLGFLVWVVGAVWLVPRGATLRSFLGWLDIQLVVTLQLSILRPFFSEPSISEVRFADIATLGHRVGALDLY